MNAEMTRHVVECLEGVLKPLGFRRKGQVFTRDVGDVTHLVQLQKSIDSTAGSVRATVNLAVWVPTLAPVRAGKPDVANVSAAPWRKRLGFVMPGGVDVWWSMADQQGARSAGLEIAAALSLHGVPALDQITSSADLLLIWKEGKSPGLTDRQRVEMISRLNNHAT